MPTIKQRILVGLARQGRIDDPTLLVPDCETDAHHIVHVLWRMRRQGLVEFSQGRQGRLRTLTKITLTDAGREALEK